MRGVLALLALFVGGVFAAQLLSFVMWPVVIGVLLIGIPWTCWQRWKHPERFKVDPEESRRANADRFLRSAYMFTAYEKELEKRWKEDQK